MARRRAARISPPQEFTTREIPPLSMRAAVVPESLNDEARTVDVIWTTGARVLREQFWGESFYEELSLEPGAVRMGRLQSGRAPVLNAHNSCSNDAVLGVVERASIDSTTGVATLRFVKGDPAVDAVWNKVRQGALSNVSVGYRIYRTEKIDAIDEKIPTVRAVDWEPHEISFCPVGADAGSYARNATEKNACIFATRAASPAKRNSMPTAARAEDDDPKKKTDEDDDVREESGSDESDEARAKRIKREREDEDEKMRRKREDEDERIRRKREDEDAGYRAEGDDDPDKDGDNDKGRSTGEDDDEETPGDKGNRSATNRIDTRADVLAAERRRVQAIYRKVDLAHLSASEKADLAKRLIEDGTPMNKIADKVLRADFDRSDRGPSDHGLGGRGGISAGRDATEKWNDGATQWLLQRAGAGAVSALRKAQKLAASTDDMPGFGEAERAYMAQPLSYDPGEFRGMTLMEVARSGFALRGDRSLKGLDKMRQAELMLTRRDWGGGGSNFFARDAAGFNTTSDFPLLLENVLHKLLLAMYAITPDTWRPFCLVGSTIDFRAHPRYRMGNFTVLSSLNEHGEFVNQSIPDAEKQSVTVTTVGTIIGISRQSLVNDDMGAFSMLAAQLGRACKLTPEVLFYNTLGLNSNLGPTLSDGLPMFDATRTVVDGKGNSYAQSNVTNSAAVSVANLDLDAVQMGSMRDPSGNELLALSPDRILVSRALRGTVNTINVSEWDTDGTSGFKGNGFQVPNRVRGMFTAIEGSPRLTGSPANRRYLFADPMLSPCFEMAFLDGQQAPQLDWRPGFRSDGLEWRARLDLGLAGIDWRGGIYNAGG